MDLNNILLEQLIAVMPGNVYWKNRSGVYLGCNQNQINLLEMEGIPVNSIVGKTIYEITAKKNADMLHSIDEQVMSSNKAITIEEPHEIANTTLIFLTKKIPLTDENNNVVGLLGISFDITERKRIEQELIDAKKQLEEANKSKAEYINQMRYLGEIVNLLPGNVFWKNRDGVYLGLNNSMISVIGLTREDAVGKKLHDFLDKEVADKVYQTDEYVMQFNKAVALEEEALNKVYLTKKTPLHDEKGNVVGLLGVSIDITERKKAEREILEAKELAENANRAKMEFLSNVVKDFRLLLKKFESTKKSADEFKEIFSDLENMATDIEGFAHFNLNAETSENNSEIISTGKAPTASVADLYKAHKHLGLSKRESESIYYLVRGMTLKQVAKQLGLSPRTVEFYVDNAKDKLGCMSKSELIAKIFSENLV